MICGKYNKDSSTVIINPGYQLFEMNFNKLLRESQFHGGRRLVERNCRWYWYISMLLLFGTTVAVICATIERFFDNPTYVVTQEAVETETKFPSVLVCPEIFYRQDKIESFLSHMDIPPNLNISYLKEVIHMLAAFYAPDILYKAYDLQNIENLLEFNSIDLDTAARLLTTSCKSTLIRCRWNNFIVNCSSIFRMELTGVGYCCVFNGKSLRDLHDVRHHDHVDEEWYTTKYGHDSGLMLAINQTQRPYNIDLSYKWLAVQTAGHFVESPINGSALNPGSEVWLEYYLTNFQIEEDARKLSSTLKKCRMAQEPLKFFPVYNQKYCMVECDLEHTLNKCNCIRLVHPRVKGTRYCKARQLVCAQHAMGKRSYVLLSAIHTKPTDSSPMQSWIVSQAEDDCYCPQACDVTIGHVKTSSFSLMPNVQAIDAFYDGLNYEKVTVARVFVKNGLVNTNTRWSYFGNIDLFAQLGGVFNVFFGCSILTLLELTVLAYRSFTSRVHSNAKAGAKPQSNQARKKDAKKAKIKRQQMRVKLVKF